MDDQAKTLVPHVPRPGLRKYLRTAWHGALATVITAGVLFSAAASVPASPGSGNDGDPPIRLYGVLESVSVGETETAPEGVSLGQIVAVLERAEQEAREQGPDFSPTVAQAAAELGMLYTTYQMQQLAFGENNEGLRVENAPAARAPEKDADAPASGADKGSSEKDGAGEDGAENDGADEGTNQDEGTNKQDGTETPAPEEDTPPAVQVADEHTSATEPHSEDAHAGYITYDQVVMAAVRLANMLDPSVPNALVEVEGTNEREGFSLRENLLDVVTMFGGSTLGYANGRIPADVLCPLEFAPGHMLRCDAAERLTALSALFEEEFGYPIPMTDSYRSYEAQVALAGIKPHLAAIPGTSNHGWGLAVDLGNPIAGGSSPEYVWLRLHGPDYGWDNPSWAQLGGAKPEPWHFEFFAAGSIPNRAIDPSDVGTWTPSDSTSPRYKPSLDPKPSDDKSDDPRKPATKPSDEPSDNPPSEKPSKPTPKPTPSDPTPKPTTPTTKPTPSPSPPDPSPSPSPTDPSPSPSPTDPSPSPSEPTEEPSTDPDPSEESPEECPETEPVPGESPATSSDAADETAADETAADDGADSGTTAEDPCAVAEGDPEGTADASSSGLLGILSSSTSAVSGGRRPRGRGLS